MALDVRGEVGASSGFLGRSLLRLIFDTKSLALLLTTVEIKEDKKPRKWSKARGLQESEAVARRRCCPGFQAEDL